MKIRPSGQRVTFDKVAVGALSGDTASVKDAVMDREFIEKSRHDWCWVDWKDVPIQTGWYQIDRIKGELVKILSQDAAKFEWHERLYVYGSGHAAVRDNALLALYIGDEYEDGRMFSLGWRGRARRAKMASNSGRPRKARETPRPRPDRRCPSRNP
jgi:hypothetical protein